MGTIFQLRDFVCPFVALPKVDDPFVLDGDREFIVFLSLLQCQGYMAPWPSTALMVRTD